jgi:purine-nucleoside phosphorylase
MTTSEEGLFDRADSAAAAITAALGAPPRIAVVLGSGLDAFAAELSEPRSIAYDAIPHFPRTTVHGHAGQLAFGSVGGAPVAVLRGRFHAYEGHPPEVVTFPVRVLQRLGVQGLILTAATGGIAERLSPGDLVCLSDHLNLLGFNPLRGPNDDRLGTRFPDMGAVYSPRLRAMARSTAHDDGWELAEAVYAAMPGPSYETPAEIRMLRALGADVVGMSTVPEAIVARHAGIAVLGLALVANWAAGLAPRPITHEEVLAAGHAAAPRLARLLATLVPRIAALPA